MILFDTVCKVKFKNKRYNRSLNKGDTESLKPRKIFEYLVRQMCLVWCRVSPFYVQLVRPCCSVVTPKKKKACPGPLGLWLTGCVAAHVCLRAQFTFDMYMSLCIDVLRPLRKREVHASSRKKKNNNNGSRGIIMSIVILCLQSHQ